KTTQVMSEFTEFVSDNVTDIVNKSKLDCSAVNNVEFTTGKGKYCDFKIVDGNIKLTQKAKSDCEVSSDNVNKIQTEIQNNIDNLIKQFSKQASKNSQEWLSTSVSVQTNDVKNISQLSNLIKNSVKTNVDNFCGGEIASAN